MRRLIYALFVLTLVSCGKEDASDETTHNQIQTICDTTVHEADSCNAPRNMFLSDGFHVVEYPGGQKLGEGHFKNGFADGFWKFYYLNGNLQSEGSYANGNITGFWKYFFENGNEKSNGHFQNCQNQGFWKYFHESSGTVKEEGNFEKGVRDGTWQYYDASGSITERINFSCG